MKSYSEMMEHKTFEDRLLYLQTGNTVGEMTFGGSRSLNQVLYRSPEWRRFRHDVIVRDNGCDLAVEGMDIYGKVIIHHINPITIEDIKNRSPKIFDMENVVCVSHNTHELIHYGGEVKAYEERKPGDTCPWR